MTDIAIGTVMRWKGQAYELTAVRPHIRRDGGATIFLVWRTHCPHCGVEFEVTTSRSKAKGDTLYGPTRHCPKHVKKFNNAKSNTALPVR